MDEPVVGKQYKPLITDDGEFMESPYEAPAGYRWRFDLLGDAGAREQFQDFPVFDGGNWACELEPDTGVEDDA